MPAMLPETRQLIETAFPNIFNHFVSPDVSNATRQYNCIAWAYGLDTVKLWPIGYGYVWPVGIPNVVEVQSFVALFASIGYIQCADDSYEDGFLKVAIFTENGVPKHAARQLPDSNWTSKLGNGEDICHTIEGMNNGFYGNATIFMRRPI